MTIKKILHIAQEIAPYVPDTVAAETELSIIQSLVEQGGEIRVFMPRWGNINERRNQLHEVIRLSGMNIVIDDTDHPLIIKVASIQSVRTQVYFIDNDDYYHRRLIGYDAQGVAYADNAERAIFYARGVLETVKKLRWMPDVIHCHGWVSAIAVLYLKTVYKDLPQFANAKVVFSAYDDMLIGATLEDYKQALIYKEVTKKLVTDMPIDFTQGFSLTQLALSSADGLILGGNAVPEEVISYAQEKQIPLLPYQTKEEQGEAYMNFYNSLLD